MADNKVNGARFSLGPRNPDTVGTEILDTDSAAVDFAVRILNNPEKAISRDEAARIITREYPSAAVDAALYKAYNVARRLKDDWGDVKERSTREAAQLVTKSLYNEMHTERMAEIYNEARTKFQEGENSSTPLTNNTETLLMKMRRFLSSAKQRLIERLPMKIEINIINKNKTEEINDD